MAIIITRVLTEAHPAAKYCIIKDEDTGNILRRLKSINLDTNEVEEYMLREDGKGGIQPTVERKTYPKAKLYFKDIEQTSFGEESNDPIGHTKSGLPS